MKFLLTAAVVLLFSFSISALNLTSEEEDQLFNDYLKKYNIRLGRDASDYKEAYISHYSDVVEHNKEFAEGLVPYELGINELSYLPYEEFIPKWTGLVEDTETNETGIPYEPELNTGRGGRADAPVNFSWLNTAGVVQAVQNQGGCGSCWAFGGVGAIEGQLAIKKNLKVKLSEQEVIECGVNPWTSALLGCNGGWHFGVYYFARDYNGIATQATKAYKANTYSSCSPARSRITQAKTPTYVDVPSKNEAAMKEALYTQGPLYVTFHVSSDFYSYRSGVYTDSRGYCTANSANNHGVLLVGYGTQNNIDYWLVKNSWGTGFGEAGYFKIQRGRNLCGIANCVNYPILA